MKIFHSVHMLLLDKIGKNEAYQLGFYQTKIKETIEEFSLNKI